MEAMWYRIKSDELKVMQQSMKKNDSLFATNENSTSVLDEDSDSDEYDITTATLCNGVPIQLDVVPASIIQRVEIFYVCANCGKVFWDGSHYENVKQQFAHILKPAENLQVTHDSGPPSKTTALTNNIVNTVKQSADKPVVKLGLKEGYDYDSEVWD